MSQRWGAAVLALTLGACAVPAYVARPGSLDAIVAHPQNYNGCAVEMTGFPSDASLSFHEAGTMRLVFSLKSVHTGVAFRYEGILPSGPAMEIYRKLHYASTYHVKPEAVRVTVKGTLRDGTLELHSIDGPGKDIAIARSTLNSR